MTRIYHSSNVIVTEPDILHSRRALDFGPGFYLTRFREQAEKYAMRFLRLEERAYLNIYEFEEPGKDFSSKKFNSYDTEWLDFIVACRSQKEHKIFDIIEGGVADDQVFNTVELYIRGLYTKEQALNELIYKKPNNQICITSQELIDKHLHFIESTELFL